MALRKPERERVGSMNTLLPISPDLGKILRLACYGDSGALSTTKIGVHSLAYPKSDDKTVYTLREIIGDPFSLTNYYHRANRDSYFNPSGLFYEWFLGERTAEETVRFRNALRDLAPVDLNTAGERFKKGFNIKLWDRPGEEDYHEKFNVMSYLSLCGVPESRDARGLLPNPGLSSYKIETFEEGLKLLCELGDGKPSSSQLSHIKTAAGILLKTLHDPQKKGCEKEDDRMEDEGLMSHGMDGGDFYADIRKVSEILDTNPKEICTVLEAETLLTWARFFAAQTVPVAFPEVYPGGSELRIKDGRNVSLVLGKSVPEITGNDIHFCPEMSTMVLTGANGGGKTHLLEMIANNTLFAHRGLQVFARDMATPPLSSLEFAVNISHHTQEGSAFQNEARYIKDMLGRLPSLPGEKSLVMLDEPFRGTDSREIVPLLIGLMSYLEKRGCFAALSTHANNIVHFPELLGQYGVHAGFFTMNPEEHRLVKGCGRSEGIRVAEKMGLDAEIVHYAREVEKQMDKDGITLSLFALPIKPKQNGKYCFIDEKTQRELSFGIDGVSDGWVSLGSAEEIFAENSRMNVCYEYPKPVPTLEGAIGRSLHDFLTKEITPEERGKRRTVLEKILASDDLAVGLHKSMKALKNFRTLFGLDYAATRFSGPAAEIAYGFSDQERKKREAFSRFVRCIGETPIDSAYNAIALLKTIDDGIGLLKDDSSEVLGSFLGGDGEKLRKEMEGIFATKMKRDEVSKHYSIAREDWEVWQSLMERDSYYFRNIFEKIKELHCYETVGKVIVGGDWHIPNAGKSGMIKVQDGKNTVLYKNNGLVPVDIEITPDRNVYILSGTNGGGKTQFLQLIGSALYFAHQFGYTPASDAELGDVPFVRARLISSEHSAEMSSFQAEAKSIGDIIADYKKVGEPEGGIVLIDEPFRGTSEEEAIPLLVGLIEYFDQRDVTLVFTTHFSGIFNTLDNLDKKINYQKLYVDYFSGDRYKVKEGIGTSSGILMAENEGVPKEIIDVAKEAFASMSTIK